MSFEKKESKEKQQQLPNKLVIDHRELPDQPIFPMFSATTHPILSGFHVIFKGVILATYLILPLITKSLTSLQIVIISAALDFWIVKNITGRLLVGLRWWVDFDQQGQQSWKFQCKVNQKDVNPASDKIFWWTMIIFSLIWIILTVINILRLDITNVTICLFCASMLIFNLYSYYRCSKAQSQNLRKLAFQYGNQMVGKFMAGTIVANYF